MATSPDRRNDSDHETPEAGLGKRGRKNLGQIDFELDFLGRILERSPFHVDVLRVHASNLAARGLHHRALQMDRRLVRLLPDRSIPRYNLACTYAVLGMTENAVSTLFRAVELGYSDLRRIVRDPDLKSLRLDPRYLRLVERMRMEPELS